MNREPHPYVEITENDVKKVTLRFLKHFYRFRPRSVDAFISADMRGLGGIVADGYLAFPQEDGQLFMATFEATSADTRHEVQFSTRRETLEWDAWAVALLLTTILRLVAHERQWLPLNSTGPWLWWALIIATAFLLAFSYKFLAASLRRYRYIHAVEQFKQYHADDQWIAISEHVFPSTEHVYFKELRRQCIHYGFGLIIVDHHFHPHLYITPAREDQFRHRRTAVKFMTQRDWMQRIQGHRYLGFFRQKLPWLFKPREGGKPRRRFGRTHFQQMVVIFFALAGIGGIYYREWEMRLIDYQEKKDYMLARLRQMQDQSLEPMIYLVDSSEIWPFRQNLRPYMGDVWEDETDLQRMAEQKKPTSQADVIIDVGGGEFALYDCTRFFNLEEKKYMIQEGAYPDLERATRRIYELTGRGVKANAIWAGCFATDQQGYIVYLEELYNSLQEASQRTDVIVDSLIRDSTELRLEIKIVYPGGSE